MFIPKTICSLRFGEEQEGNDKTRLKGDTRLFRERILTTNENKMVYSFIVDRNCVLRIEKIAKINVEDTKKRFI